MPNLVVGLMECSSGAKSMAMLKHSLAVEVSFLTLSVKDFLALRSMKSIDLNAMLRELTLYEKFKI